MTQEEKQLLLKDLCVRLPYGVMVQCITESIRRANASPLTETLNTVLYRYAEKDNIELKPYLRPMSSMTEEEKEELMCLFGGIPDNDYIYKPYTDIPYNSFGEVIDWLNAHHFDYCGLIEKGLALEASEGMYNL